MTTPTQQQPAAGDPAAAAAATPPAPGTPEHAAAMAAKAQERMGAPAAAKPTKPEGIPDKFWDAEKGEVRVAEMAKSYTELEKKTPPAPAAKPDLKISPAPAAGDPAAAQAAVDKAGLNMAEFNAEYAEKGALSPESYAKLAEKGFDKDTVDTYIEGQKARAERYDAAAFEASGSKEKFFEMTKWAASNLKPAEIAAFNAAVTSGDVEQMRLAVTGVRAKFEASEGSSPNLLTGGARSTGNDVTGFASKAEMVEAMKDPRYKKDPAYRAQVAQRVKNANFNQVTVLN